MKAIRKLLDQKQGQSLIELAIIFALILMLLGGVFDLGRAFFTYMALRDAAQEGASYASIDPSNSTEIVNRVRNSSHNPVDLTDTTEVQVNVTVAGPACMGTGVTVDVNYNNFPITFPFLSAVLGRTTFPIHATVTDSVLRPPCP